jgi:hypothetical protein
MGSDMEPAPVAGLAANFSPMPRIAPPPFGREIAGGATRKDSPGLLASVLRSGCVAI